MKYRLENESIGALSVIDYSITPLKVLLKSIIICWLLRERVPAGSLYVITKLISINQNDIR